MPSHRRPQGFQRIDRIADQLQRELAALVQMRMKDPRLGMVTIQHVKVSKDLAWADVYFTLLGQGREDGLEAEQVLAGAAGWLRSELAGVMRLRTIPRLRFHYDETPEQADRVARLLQEDRQRGHRRPGDGDPAGEDGENGNDGEQ